MDRLYSAHRSDAPNHTHITAHRSSKLPPPPEELEHVARPSQAGRSPALPTLPLRPVPHRLPGHRQQRTHAPEPRSPGQSPRLAPPLRPLGRHLRRQRPALPRGRAEASPLPLRHSPPAALLLGDQHHAPAFHPLLVSRNSLHLLPLHPLVSSEPSHRAALSQLSSATQHSIDRRLRQRRHHRISVRIRMHPFKAKSRLHPAVRIRHRRVIVQINQRMAGAIPLQPRIQRLNLRRRMHLRTPRKRRCRENRSYDDANPIRLRQLHHRQKIILRHLRSHRSSITGNIIRPGQNHHRRRMQIDHILTKPHHHLRSSLPADPAIHVRLARKKYSSSRPSSPAIGNRIPIKHHSLLTRRSGSQCSILRPIPPQLRPVRQLRFHRGNLLGGNHPSRSRSTRRGRHLRTTHHSYKTQSRNHQDPQQLHHVCSSKIKSLVRQRLVDRSLSQRRHHLIALHRRMNAVHRKLSLHPTLRVHQRRVVVQIHQRMRRTILLQPRVQRPNLLLRMQSPPPRKIRRRCNGSKDRLNPIRLRQLRHRLPVLLGHLRRHRPRIPCDIVRPLQNHHRLRMQIDHVLPKSHHHLRRSLSADPAVHVLLPRKEGTPVRPPVLRYRCPIKHHPILTHRRLWQRRIRRPIMLQLRPIRQLRLHLRNLPSAYHRCDCRSRLPRPRLCQSSLQLPSHSRKAHTSQQNYLRQTLHSPITPFGCVPILAHAPHLSASSPLNTQPNLAEPSLLYLNK